MSVSYIIDIDARVAALVNDKFPDMRVEISAEAIEALEEVLRFDEAAIVGDLKEMLRDNYVKKYGA